MTGPEIEAATQITGTGGEYSAGGRNDFVLRVLDLHKTYRTGFLRRRTVALGGISFVVPRASIFAIVGPNGAGKTTTLKTILDLVRANLGSVELFGIDNRDPRCRERVGYLPERPCFYEHLNSVELLRFYGNLFGMSGEVLEARIDELLELLGLGDRRKAQLRTCSKGMLQRLGLAQAMLNDPDLLILDEPMSGLDPAGRRQVRNLLAELKNRGKTIILSSHIVPDVQALADTVAIMKNGRIEALVDLAGNPGVVSFDIVISSRPAGEFAAKLLKSCTIMGESDGGLIIQVPDTELLQNILAVCNDHGIHVNSIDSHRVDLEAAFMANIHGDTPATEPVAESADARSGRHAAAQSRHTTQSAERVNRKDG